MQDERLGRSYGIAVLRFAFFSRFRRVFRRRDRPCVCAGGLGLRWDGVPGIGLEKVEKIDVSQ